MTLDDYLTTAGISGLSFAKKAGVSPMTIARARRGRAIGYLLAAQMVAASGGVISLDSLCRGARGELCRACGRPLPSHSESTQAAE